MNTEHLIAMFSCQCVKSKALQDIPNGTVSFELPHLDRPMFF